MITGLIWSEIKQLWDMGLKDYVSDFLLSTFYNRFYLVPFGFNWFGFNQFGFNWFIWFYLVSIETLDSNGSTGERHVERG